MALAQGSPAGYSICIINKMGRQVDSWLNARSDFMFKRFFFSSRDIGFATAISMAAGAAVVIFASSANLSARQLAVLLLAVENLFFYGPLVVFQTNHVRCLQGWGYI